MTYNIIKTMTNSKTGRKTCVLLLDGLSSILDIKSLDKALKMARMFNENSDSGWKYEVRGTNGKIIKDKK